MEDKKAIQIVGLSQFRHATEAVWEGSEYIVKPGEIIVYDPDEVYKYPRLKIGEEGEEGEGSGKLARKLPFACEEGKVEEIISLEDFQQQSFNKDLLYSVLQGNFYTGGLKDGSSVCLFVDQLPGSGLSFFEFASEKKVFQLRGYYNKSDSQVSFYITADGKTAMSNYVDSLDTSEADERSKQTWKNKINLLDSDRWYPAEELFPKDGDMLGIKWNGVIIDQKDIKTSDKQLQLLIKSELFYYSGNKWINCSSTQDLLKAEGRGAEISNDPNNVALGQSSHAEGTETRASGHSSHSGGYKTQSVGKASFSHGIGTTANGDGQFVVGTYNNTNSDAVFIVGIGADDESRKNALIVDKDGTSYFEGDIKKAIEVEGETQYHSVVTEKELDDAFSSKVIQSGARADSTIGAKATVEGANNEASGRYAHAEGTSTTASGSYSHAEGNGSKASNTGDHAEGYETVANGTYSHAEGYQTQTSAVAAQSATGAHAEGYKTSAKSMGAHSEGIETIAGQPMSTFNSDGAHAEGYKTTSVGRGTHSEGVETQAGKDGFSIMGAHAEGVSTQATADAAHAEGSNTVASGKYSHAEGSSTQAIGEDAHAEGQNTYANGVGDHAEGQYTRTEGKGRSHAAGNHTIAWSNQYVIGHWNAEVTGANATGIEGPAFIIGNGVEDKEDGTSRRANAFVVNYSGDAHGKAFKPVGADYAELFEWLDGNYSNEDRRGYFVTMEGEKIKKAEPNDYILGIVSSAPGILGNNPNTWHGRYQRDDFGTILYEDHHYIEKIINPETGEEESVITTDKIFKQNDEYNSELKYTPREERPEWAAIGMLGVLAVRDDGTCRVNGFCAVAEGGIATASETGYRVIKRVNDHVVKVVFK